MIENLYSIQDTKTGVFCRPFTAINDEYALRDFGHAAADPSTNIGRYPTDFVLFRIGFFNFQTGAITQELAPISVAVASSLVRDISIDRHIEG